MSNCISPSPTTTVLNKKQRLFSPVVLFHDHRFMRDGDLEHIHIPYKDPQLIESHKKRIDQMLQDNGRFWADVMVACTREKPLSPVPSLVSSSPPSPHWSSSSPPPAQPPPPRVQQQHRYPSRHRRVSKPSSATAAAVVTPPPPLPATATATSTATTTDHQHYHHHHHHHRHYRQQNNSVLMGAGGGGSKKRQRNNLPKPVTAILKAWLAAHKKHPYPSEDEKCQLVRQTGLARNQISNWFINARRRILRPMLMEEGDEEEDDDEDEYVKWRPAAPSSSSSNRLGVNLT